MRAAPPATQSSTGGEIVVSSPRVMGSYWKLPEATQRAIQGEWFFTGDAGYLDERRGQAVKAVVVKKAGAEVTPGELITWARQHIAGYKLPKSVDFIEALPRNPTGKILKRELRKAYWGNPKRQVN
jgi:acyl-CoA synthetase (AMP-forming)/AMP-acid ligase II